MSLNNREGIGGYPSPFLDSTTMRRDAVAEELAALRAEIKAIRDALSPPRSAILTGPEVERVFSALKGGAA